MLMYAAADLHGHRSRLHRVAAQVALHRPDVVLLAGDTLGCWQATAVLDVLNRLDRPVLMIRGNSDSRRLPRLLGPFPRLCFLDRSAAHVAGVAIIGFSGTLPLPFHSRLSLDEAGISAAGARLLTPGSVLLVHPPPYGIRDRVLGRFHAGSRVVKRLVDSCSPAVVVCGHIHEQAGISAVADTWVVNCAVGSSGHGALIAYDGRSAPVCRMLPLEA